MRTIRYVLIAMAVTVGVAACGGSDSGTSDAAPSVTEPNNETSKAASTTATVSFDEPGTYSYYCKQHNAMNGTVTVR